MGIGVVENIVVSLLVCLSVHPSIHPSIVLWLFMLGPKLKESADKRLNVIQTFKFVFKEKKNNLGKGQNAGYLHFVLFPLCFSEAVLIRVDKSGLCGKGLVLFS